jgi:hypothetical protein
MKRGTRFQGTIESEIQEREKKRSQKNKRAFEQNNHQTGGL